MSIDSSNGYEQHAGEFMRNRSRIIGVDVIRQWCRGLPRGAATLELGCGFGMPISETLVQEGLSLFAVDASAAMVAAFRERFPNVPVECAPAESASFFNRTFDAVVSWGLLFLLTPETQRTVIRKAAGVLEPGGQFLFTAPSQVTSWNDNLTGRESVSLGFDAYVAELQASGLVLDRTATDEGDNFYYFASSR